MNIPLIVFYTITSIVLFSGIVALFYYPLAVMAEIRSRRPSIYNDRKPLVSIIVPAYNEEKVVGNCVESILRSEYTKFEVILVDDGSSDSTYSVMQRYQYDPRIKAVTKPNGGKASALNLGFSLSKGEVLLFVDADGLFTGTTILEMLNRFNDKKVGAVCGNDAPVNLDRILTQLMNIQTRVGTGFVRRALSEVNCLPIVSGNVGAFRRSVLEKTNLIKGIRQRPKPGATETKRFKGPFLEGFIGEDLELTWRIHQAGYQVKFAPRAIVMAEVPSTINGLWKQRVRWARGLLQTISIHRHMFFNLKYGLMGLYLPINFLNMVIIPILQLVIAFLIILFVFTGYSPISLDLLSIILWFGLGGALFTAIFGIALDRAWKDLKYFYVLPFWIPYSLLMDAVTVWAIILEMRGVEVKWNKLDRTGVVTRNAFSKEKKEL